MLAAVAVAWACVAPPPAEYDTRVDAKKWVETLSDEIREGDGLVIHPFANWLVGCYGDWPIRFKVERRLAPGFVVEVLRPNTLTVMSEHPREPLTEFLNRHRFGRVFYLAERINVPAGEFPVRLHREIQRVFEDDGYEKTDSGRTWATELTVYRRASMKELE